MSKIKIKCSAEMLAELALTDGIVAAYRIENGIHKEYKYVGVEIQHPNTIVFIFDDGKQGDDRVVVPMVTDLSREASRYETNPP